MANKALLDQYPHLPSGNLLLHALGGGVMHGTHFHQIKNDKTPIIHQIQAVSLSKKSL
jgi:hypothetical protein